MRKLLFEPQSQDQDEIDSPFPGYFKLCLDEDSAISFIRHHDFGKEQG
jgi:hypothetical protein